MGLNTPQRIGVDWRSVARGAAFGLIIIVPLAIYQSSLHDPCNPPFWIFFVLLFSLLVSGYVAGDRRRDAAFTQGALGALAAIAIWIVLRLVRNAIVGHSVSCGNGLLGIIEVGVLAIAFGGLGGFLSARRAARDGADAS